MQTLKNRLKNRAFILVITLILITFIFGSFLLGYRIIYRKGERMNSYLSTVESASQVHNLKTLIYDELIRIDKSISSGEYENGLEYIGFEKIVVVFGLEMVKIVIVKIGIFSIE